MMNGFRMEMNSAREWYLVGTLHGGDLEYNSGKDTGVKVSVPPEGARVRFDGRYGCRKCFLRYFWKKYKRGDCPRYFSNY